MWAQVRQRAVRSLIAATLVLAAPLGLSLAGAETAPVRSASTTQMSSAPELVRVSALNDATKRQQNFNRNWKFKLGDQSGADASNYDDSSWGIVQLPHDYSIDQDYTRSGEAESAYKPAGIGWYRKSFEVSRDFANKRVVLSFDGIYMDSTVWVNGQLLANHPYGYTPFAFDITEYLRFGEQNTIAIKVNAQIPSSRWYAGAGIGRNVDMIVTDPVHVARDGVVVTTPELATQASGAVTTVLKTTVQNDGTEAASVQVEQTVFMRGGDPAQAIAQVSTTQQLAAGARETFEARANTTSAPALWDTEHPNLYTVRTIIKKGDQVLDSYDTDFGYRFISYDSETGFKLNGKPVKIKGVCMHHDQGALGSVSTYDALHRQVRILKDMGANSIRTSHNTPARELVQICNEEGILLDLEFFDGWTVPKNSNRNDYSRFFNQAMGESKIIGSVANKTWAQFDLEQSIARDINAPSIIMWSLGNEMTEGTNGMPGLNTVQANLIRWATAADATRPVTTGDNKLKGNNTILNPAGLATADGIVGLNYAGGAHYDSTHRNHPTWKLIGSETASAINSRGIYSTYGRDNNTQQLTSYDYYAVGWGHKAAEAWYDVLMRDFVAGEYVWTGFDYLGEPTPWNGVTGGAQGRWPSPKNSYFGIIDTAGLPKDSFYLYQSQWNDHKHTLHVVPDWSNTTKRENNKVDVVVYTDAPTVKLFFTPAGSTERQELGTKTFTQKTTPTNGFSYQIYEGDGRASNAYQNLYLTWKVPYAEGTITAEAYDRDGSKIDTSSWDGIQTRSTTGVPARIELVADRSDLSANGTDLSYLTARIVDANGKVVNSANNRVSFAVEGSATLAGLDNGSSPDHQSYRDNNRAAHAGQLIAIVRATEKPGAITVRATADGLESASVTLNAASITGNAQGKQVESLFYARHYYVKTGTTLELPETIQARYTDGSVADEPVVWDEYDAAKLNEASSFDVGGTVAGLRVSVSVTSLDNIVALANYSTNTPVGQPPILPGSRPAIQADGTILYANFPVTWETPADDAFNAAGTVVIQGHANVFGRDMNLTATVRVQEETIELSGNIAPVAHLTQSIPEGQTSDVLTAINDGSATLASNPSGGPNSTCWSNYDYSQKGNSTASITFRYDTQQRVGQAKVHFFTDSWSARLPKAGTTVFEVSEDGERWTRVETRETIGTARNNVTPYTYEFAPTLATYVRLTVTNNDQNLGNRKPCTGITEVELTGVRGSYQTHTNADLGSLTVNGKAVDASALAAGRYKTPAIIATVEPVAANNTAVTLLPEHEGVIRMVLESEDHKTVRTMEVVLGEETELPADDDSRDVELSKITVSAGSEVADNHVSATEGKITFAFDNNPRTYWHSSWSPAPLSERWVQIAVGEPVTIDALRYLGRRDATPNGMVTEGLLQYSEDGVTWHDAGTAQWKAPNSAGYKHGWQLLTLEQPVTGRYFRFQGTHTYADTGSDKFMSASEIRLRKVKEPIDIATARIDGPRSLEVEKLSVEHPGMFEPTALTVTLPGTNGTADKTLTYGLDYALEYSNNTEAGTATVVARGLDAYGGRSLEHTFTLTRTPPTLEGISVSTQPTKMAYAIGEKFNPAGMVLTLAMSDGSESTLAYGADNAAKFSFEPSLDTAFTTEGATDVTVTYGGKTATLSVMVTRPAPTTARISLMIDDQPFGEPFEVELGKPMPKPTQVPTKEGYVFKYWAVEKMVSRPLFFGLFRSAPQPELVEYDFSQPVTGPLTLYAVFERAAQPDEGNTGGNTGTELPGGGSAGTEQPGGGSAGTEQPGGGSTGTEQPGGNAGTEQPGSGNTGTEQPGDNTGSTQPGGSEQPGDNTGGNTSGTQPGSTEQPGGSEQPGNTGDNTETGAEAGSGTGAETEHAGTGTGSGSGEHAGSNTDVNNGSTLGASGAIGTQGGQPSTDVHGSGSPAGGSPSAQEAPRTNRGHGKAKKALPGTSDLTIAAVTLLAVAGTGFGAYGLNRKRRSH
ncbi:discoidin domain-containing protein [Collinsella sp. zg1085]|nr:discoidin domain-containing protein [Collinsella sp. zg1085]